MDIMNTARQPLNYSYQELERTLRAVFNSVYIENYKLKALLFQSYRSNLFHFVEYAVDNGIDPKAHILDIRNVLLGSDYATKKIKGAKAHGQR